MKADLLEAAKAFASYPGADLSFYLGSDCRPCRGCEIVRPNGDAAALVLGHLARISILAARRAYRRPSKITAIAR